MQEILATKTLYDAEFDRIQKTFGPMLQYLDHGKTRTILFIDPLKVASAQAYGIDPVEFLNYQLREKHLLASDASIKYIFNNASQGSFRPLLYAAGTNPMVLTVADAFHENMADVVIPKTHLTDLRINIEGMKPSELSSFVNYHEFFHCLHDKYAGKSVPGNVHQKREMFADVGALLELIRQGSDPKLIGAVIDWRAQGKDADHATIPALEALKDYVRQNGVDRIRKMTDREMLEVDYQITEKSASGTLHYMLQEAWGQRPDMRIFSSLSNLMALVPTKWDPSKALEEKAFAMGHKITPQTLMLANNALQAEYAAARDKNPSTPAYQWMMLMVQDTYMKSVTRADYEKVNAAHGATLTAEDRKEIAFVKSGSEPIKIAPAPGARRPSS